MSNPDRDTDFQTLRIRRFIPASPDQVFRAWTDPDKMKKWWGPKDVRCLTVETDLRVGGQYRIENAFPDGSVLWIAGEFEAIEKPRLLIYTWVVETAKPTTERVEVRFEPRDAGTNVTIIHKRITTVALSEQHQKGWLECMDGLVEYFVKP